MNLNPVATVLSVALGLLAANASPAPAHPQMVPAGFVRLSTWAREKGFALAGVERDGAVRLRGQSAKLCFKTDSALAEINGVHVWLCQPVVARAGEPWISALDLRDTIDPILYPRRRHRITTICLDPGHGGKDTGGVVRGRAEKEYTLALARELARQLKAAGFRVVLTRTRDTFVSLDDRAEFAHRRQAGLFISLHFNIAAPGQGRGVEVYCLTPPRASSTNAGGQRANPSVLPGNHDDPQNVFLAYELQSHLVRVLGAEDRGLRRARFEVLRSAQMPAVLIEGGFLSDPLERAGIASSKHRTQLANAIVQGVAAYLGSDRPRRRGSRS